MNQNVGEYDRVMRLAIGTALVVVGAAGSGGLLLLAVGPLPQGLTSIAVFLIGVILIVTGALRTCPVYMGIGMNTFRKPRPPAEPNEDPPAETEA
ncbi:MAG: DUF2892 domain-containing protein [Halobacteriales archaeon]|nr:DUF2892 domain-containing protein [Halobacteriales archaeon]